MKPGETALASGFLILALSVCGCDMVYRLVHKEGAEEKELLGEIVPYEANEGVVEVQHLLKLYGYKVGKVDGVLGANTRNAIAAFQEDNGIKISRFVDRETWNRLHIFEDYGLIKSGELNIKTIQQALVQAGLDPGPIDGKLGRRTQTAIEDFQRKEGLTPDGRVGLQTLVHLSQYLSVAP